MTNQEAQAIREVFREFDRMYPDKSTEFLFELTCQHPDLQGLNLDHNDVVEAFRMNKKIIITLEITDPETVEAYWWTAREIILDDLQLGTLANYCDITGLSYVTDEKPHDKNDQI